MLKGLSGLGSTILYEGDKLSICFPAHRTESENGFTLKGKKMFTELTEGVHSPSMLDQILSSTNSILNLKLEAYFDRLETSLFLLYLYLGIQSIV